MKKRIINIVNYKFEFVLIFVWNCIVMIGFHFDTKMISASKCPLFISWESTFDLIIFILDVEHHNLCDVHIEELL